MWCWDGVHRAGGLATVFEVGCEPKAVDICPARDPSTVFSGVSTKNSMLSTVINDYQPKNKNINRFYKTSTEFCNISTNL
ncbi:hypothetical protein [Ornithinibacillus californiensis]|uniref:hypothetical protein n=1 Tax=Ornithinibacillus californiensis TaxID=161536 RepID=UPI00064DD618|nr:hypothetical protein [Ornithinibacillus californiensis]